jgi:dienelactone hydrolase
MKSAVLLSLAIATPLFAAPVAALQPRTQAATQQALQPTIQPTTQPAIQPSIQLPAVHTSRPVPALLVVGGFESAGKVLSLLHPKMPVALASFDYPFQASRDLKFPQSLRDLPEAKQVFPKTVAGIHELVDRLTKMPEIDPRRIIIVGASFGAPFALAAAAQDPRISGIVIVHGFGKLADTAENVLIRAWRPRWGFLARPFAWTLSRALWAYLDPPKPEDMAERLSSNQHVLMISAEEDSFVPREATDSLAQALTHSAAAVKRISMPGGHLMPGSDSLIAEIEARIEAWLLAAF